MRLAGHEAGLGGQQRIAVGGCGLHGHRRDAVAGAAAVLDDDASVPHICDRRWPTARVRTSVNAPAAEVTTMVTVRLG